MREEKGSRDIENQLGFQDKRRELPDLERIEERARELAVIRGMSPDDVTNEDRRQARQELQLGALSPEQSDEMMLAGTDNRNPADPPAMSGGEAPHADAFDEQAWQADLAEHGNEQASHDEMLEGQELPEDLEDEDLEDTDQPGSR